MPKKFTGRRCEPYHYEIQWGFYDKKEQDYHYDTKDGVIYHDIERASEDYRSAITQLAKNDVIRLVILVCEPNRVREMVLAQHAAANLGLTPRELDDKEVLTLYTLQIA